MKAMILAAGRGTRLRPLTDTRPKALVEVAGRPLLEFVLRRLCDAGVREVVINLHHFGEQIEAWIAQHGAFGMKTAFSREAELLDTGGALAHASWFFDDDRPFFVHNVDVLSDIDLRAMLRAHVDSGAVATIAVLPRETTRPLLFDSRGALCGRRSADGDRLVRTPQGAVEPFGFCGIHVVSSGLLADLPRGRAFSIVDTYLERSAVGAEPPPVRAFRADGCQWRDAGRLENLYPL